MYLLDTNLYIEALRNADDADRLWARHRALVPNIWLSAVVVFELLAGARDDRQAGEYERALFAPFRGRGRLLVPRESTWSLVARVERNLRGHGGYARSPARRSFLNDMLLAAMCRQAGATLVTVNARDFAVIRTVFAFRYVTALPTS